MRLGAVFSGAVLVLTTSAFGQEAATDATATEEAESDSEVGSVIEEESFVSPRTHAMGGAVITVADDLDAAFTNPAGIGGLGWGKKDPPYTRKLYFPWLGVGANKNSAGLYREVRNSEEGSKGAMTKAIVDAHGGERQYARSNMILGLVFGRTMVVPFADLQLAATSQGEGSDTIDMKYRSMTGVGYGFSAQDGEGRLSLGYFGYSATRSETSGEFSYLTVIDAEERKAALADNSADYTGIGHNAGIIWRMSKTGKPSLGIAMKNIGDTTFAGKGDDLVIKQDLAAGFSVSPQVGKSGSLNMVIQADRLMDDEVSFTKKYRVGLELNLDGTGTYATFALRGGFNDAGPSGGLQLNLGLIAVEATVFNVDIGAGNEKVVEQRYMSTIMVNVAEF